MYIKTKKGKNIVLTSLQASNFSTLKSNLETCFQVYFIYLFNIFIRNLKVQKKSKTKTFLAYLGKGAYKILKLPFKMTSGLLFSLEKVFLI